MILDQRHQGMIAQVGLPGVDEPSKTLSCVPRPRSPSLLLCCCLTRIGKGDVLCAGPQWQWEDNMLRAGHAQSSGPTTAAAPSPLHLSYAGARHSESSSGLRPQPAFTYGASC